MTRARDFTDAALRQWKEERPDLDASGMAVVLRLQILAARLSERLKETLAPVDLAPFEYDVLATLRRSRSDGGLTQRELCRAAQITSGSMTHRIDRLEKRGLVRRRPSREDRRQVEVVLSAKGARLVDAVLGARMRDALDFLGPLSPGKRHTLAGLLRELALEEE